MTQQETKSQQQPQKSEAQQRAEEAYKKEFDEFVSHYMSLNEWARIELLFNMRLNMDALFALIQDLQKKVGEGQKEPKKPLTLVPK